MYSCVYKHYTKAKNNLSYTKFAYIKYSAKAKKNAIATFFCSNFELYYVHVNAPESYVKCENSCNI